MPAIQSLKKQLRGIRSTQKLTKAMKTASTVKFSKLNGIYGEYAEYGNRCREMLQQYGDLFLDAFREKDSAAPAAVVVLSSNKGLCGSFNTEIFKFAGEQFPGLGDFCLIPCGKTAVAFFREQKLPAKKNVAFNDVPTYEESSALFDEIVAWRRAGKVSRVYVIYPEYINMMTQRPTVFELFSSGSPKPDASTLLIPDRDTVMENTAKTVFRAMFYKLVLESALGAQAATMMTMRSAYDTATEYYDDLERKINRLRQSSVTADIIETSVKDDE